MGSSPNTGPFEGPFCKGAVLYLGPKRPECRELTIHIAVRCCKGAVLYIWDLRRDPKVEN